MTKNSELSIDDLIKRIYKSYIEIKVGEFPEIHRDLLLKDIASLYSSIKNLYPKTDLLPKEIELDFITSDIKEVDNEKTNQVIEQSENTNEPIEKIQSSIAEDNKSVDFMAPSNLYEEDRKSNQIDLSIFEDVEELELSPLKTQDQLVDIKSDNTSSPILQGFQNFNNDVTTNQIKKSDFEEHNVIQEDASIEKLKDKEINNSDNGTIQQTTTNELDKKNTGSIIDFLHHEDNKSSKDIYSFLDLNTRIGLIELFFKGNSLELTECLIKLNKLDSREASLDLLNKYAANFNVSDTEDIYLQFVNLIDRKLDHQHNKRN